MKRTGLFLLSAVAAFGCQRDDKDLSEQLGRMEAKQDKILDAIKTMPAARPGANRPQRPQRPKPAPNSVYSVNINGAPFRGAKDAKVTIVEAFEFA